MDDQQRAMELFDKWAESSGKTVHGFNRIEDMWDAWQAATAALRAAPEVTEAMVEAAHAAYWSHPDDRGEDRPCIRAALEAALTARPQGVSDG